MSSLSPTSQSSPDDRPHRPAPGPVPPRMRAVLVNAQDSASLHIAEVDTPIPGANDVLVRVKAAGVNRLDLLQRKGRYPVPEGDSTILGVEVSGTVAQISPEAQKISGLSLGDRVCGLCNGGGYSEYAIIPAELAMPIPDTLTFHEAAAIPEAFLTAYSALFWSAGVTEKSKSILIHAGASGVGLAAVQIASIDKPEDRQIIVTAGTEEKIAVCQALGATHGVNYKSGPFADVVYGISNHRGVDAVIDFVGGPYFQQNVDCAALDGKIVLLGMLGGPELDTGLGFNLGLLLRKRLTVVGSTLRNRDLAYKAKLTKEFFEYAAPLFDSDRLQATVYKVFTMDQAEEAHAVVQANENIGKVILAWQLKTGLTPASSISTLNAL
ncbi:quinone oxidoreductase [Capsaspora owczarzaki ATCC 30864]|uniref:Quinone oxidoreductase n=1 Tax=Capsaspora owczarzaki (strain ATCC 30864) TaxID=595528 RepID=A0A0D2X1Z2_CAPO3|nr:quinone oxidoreductase [Capsaspora owczarzaki ATCC 30864]KJE91654.1 quinone oxidoreductase [Capsaspora owczarzaki ATCC 30864]|eukprot:XP_004349514.1 quinone oxidoreductase [Capsaspora owczarzaki ATCC 30864]